MPLQIQFSTSTAFTSGIIRRLTHSPFSHVDFVLPDGLLGVSGKDASDHCAPSQGTTPTMLSANCAAIDGCFGGQTLR
jgi:hypothetical protein